MSYQRELQHADVSQVLIGRASNFLQQVSTLKFPAIRMYGFQVLIGWVSNSCFIPTCSLHSLQFQVLIGRLVTEM